MSPAGHKPHAISSILACGSSEVHRVEGHVGIHGLLKGDVPL